MAFTINDLQTFQLYQTRLKAEAKKVGTSGHFAFFKDCTLGDGHKKDVLIVGAGATQTRNLEQMLKQSGARFQASGSCVYGDDGLTLTVATGSLAGGNLHNLGMNVHLAGPDTAQTTEGGQPTTGGGFQRATPSHAQPRSDMALGNQERDGIAAFVKQRTDLLKYAQEYLKSMEYFRDRAGAAVVQANGLIARADGGERSEVLAQSIEGALTAAQELRQAAHGAYEEQGTHVAKERQLNPASFGLTGEIAVKTGARGQALFQEVTDITQKASAAHREILVELDEAARGLELSLPLARTGQADLANLLRYLDSLLESIGSAQNLLQKNYDLANVLSTLTALVQRDTPNDQLGRALNQARQSVQAKEAAVLETLGQIQKLAKAALLRIKQAPQGHPDVAQRFEKVKAALSDATAKKREFDQKHKEWPALEQQVKARLGQA